MPWLWGEPFTPTARRYMMGTESETFNDGSVVHGWALHRWPACYANESGIVAAPDHGRRGEELMVCDAVPMSARCANCMPALLGVRCAVHTHDIHTHVRMAWATYPR